MAWSKPGWGKGDGAVFVKDQAPGETPRVDVYEAEVVPLLAQLRNVSCTLEQRGKVDVAVQLLREAVEKLAAEVRRK